MSPSASDTAPTVSYLSSDDTLSNEVLTRVFSAGSAIAVCNAHVIAVHGRGFAHLQSILRLQFRNFRFSVALPQMIET